ncbi:MAG: cell division protein FtsA [Patescibacteria group bacterium]
MSRNIITGIDIGTQQVKVVVCQRAGENEKMPKIIGIGTAESKGLRNGYIIDQDEVKKSIKIAVAQAEKISKLKIRKAFVSVGGIGLGSIMSQGVTIVSRADLEITALDIKKAQEASQHEIPATYIQNRRIVHTIPLSYKIDGKIALGKPEGMKGSRLEVKTLYITCLEQHLNYMISTVEDAGIEVEDVMASSIAAGLVILSKQQKTAGCILANIGAETVSIVVFENNIPISLEVFDIGSTDITNDIALGLKVPLEEAEQIKIGTITGTSYPRRKLEEIINARLSDIFELIETHLRKIGRNGLLPAGIIITGGGSGINNIEEFAKNTLKLPSKIAMRDSPWAIAYGLCVFGFTAEGEDTIGTSSRIIVNTKNKFIEWIKQFLP